jgi:glycine reductase
LLHPNELFDGALTTDNRRGSGVYETTWTWQNHPVLHELFDRHGKELNFLGIIAQRVRFESEFGKRITGLAASQMAKLLGADGAIILRHHVSGNTFTDIMLTVQACEKKGIKTVLMTPEWGGKGSESPLVFYVPEATAMVSNGSFERDIKVPVPTKIIGVGDYQLVEGQDGDKPFSPIGELTLPSAILITSGIDWFGYLDMTSIQY